MPVLKTKINGEWVNIGSTAIDETLTKAGVAADAKAVRDLVNSLNLYVDDTLSLMGVAADASAVGEALAEKVDVKSGWGDSGNLQTVTDLDNISGNGVFLYQGEAFDDFYVELGGNGGFGIVVNMDYLNYGYGKQIIYMFHNTYTNIAVRSKIMGSWFDWEWISPPLITGIEYKTTEKYNQEPVYTMLVDCGALTANTPKEVWIDSLFNTSSKQNPIRCEFVGKSSEFDGNSVSYVSTSNISMTARAYEVGHMYTGQLHINLESPTDMTESFVRVWYTKED